MQTRVEYILSNVKGKILDVGCSACTLHQKVKESFPLEDVYGVDIEITKNTKYYRQASAEKIPFESAFFDSLIAGELIEHLENPEEFVKEAARVLRKGGAMVLTTPNKDSLINRIFGSYNTDIHISLFNKSELFALLKKHGFEVQDYVVLPYTKESSEGSQNKWSFLFRKMIHYLLPNELRENQIVLARKA